MDIEDMAENLGLEVEDVNELLELYDDRTSSDLKTLKISLDAGDAQRIHETAHSIKGSSGNIGLNDLYDLAREIDDRARVNNLNGLEVLIQDLSAKFRKLVREIK